MGLLLTLFLVYVVICCCIFCVICCYEPNKSTFVNAEDHAITSPSAEQDVTDSQQSQRTRPGTTTTRIPDNTRRSPRPYQQPQNQTSGMPRPNSTTEWRRPEPPTDLYPPAHSNSNYEPQRSNLPQHSNSSNQSPLNRPTAPNLMEDLPPNYEEAIKLNTEFQRIN